MICWDHIVILGFVESTPSKTEVEGYRVYSVDEIAKIEFDYILLASWKYEHEMRVKLKEIGVETTKIITGSLDADNIFKNKFLFSCVDYTIWQNAKILNNIRFSNERNLFWDYAKGVNWISSQLSLSPGGMAVGYDYLYVLCRTLEIIRPQNILELGLGQSSKIFLSYYNSHSSEYSIIEQSNEWYDFFKSENDIASGVNVHIRPLVTSYDKNYDKEINCFSEIGTIVRNKKFSFISIDGPWGSDGISRCDLLPYIPECLDDNFLIIIDDYNRPGEKEMVRCLEERLKKHNIEFLKRIYGSRKQFCIITSSNNLFLCSLYDIVD